VKAYNVWRYIHSNLQSTPLARETQEESLETQNHVLDNLRFGRGHEKLVREDGKTDRGVFRHIYLCGTGGVKNGTKAEEHTHT
jgi:hypothetical protein